MTTGERSTRVDHAEASLRALIAEYQADGSTRLPPEKELSERLAISRATLRDALTRLEIQGEITRRRRVGTLISRPRPSDADASSLAYPVNLILSLSEFLKAIGVSYAVRTVTVRRESAGPGDVAVLGVPDGGSIYRASRLYEVEGRAAAMLEHKLPATLKGQRVQIDSLTEGITTFLRETAGIRLTRSDHTITAEAATADLAAELELPEGSPLLVLYCQLYADDPTAIASGRLVFRPDVLSLTATATPIGQLRPVPPLGPTVNTAPAGGAN